MTPLQVATLGIRLTGLIWAVVAVSNSYQWIAFLRGAASDDIDPTMALSLVGLQLATCVVLLMFPATIATMLLPSLRSTKEAAPSHPLEWQTIGVIFVGLWVLARAIPDAFYWATFYFAAHRSGFDVLPLGPEHWAGIVTTVVEILVGIWLTVGGKGLAQLLFRIRTAGLGQ